MAWTPSEIALIITTTTTALTAVAGYVIPFWRDHISKRDQRKEQKYQQISDGVYYCVRHYADVLKHMDRMQENKAYFEAKVSGSNSPSGFEDVDLEFNRALATVEVCCAEIGVTSNQFVSAISAGVTANKDYAVVDGKVTDGNGNKDAEEIQTQAANDMKIAAAALLNEAREKLGVK